MHTIDDLNLKLLSELKEMAEAMGVKNAKKLTKEELVYKILDQQAVKGEPTAKTENASAPFVIYQQLGHRCHRFR